MPSRNTIEVIIEATDAASYVINSLQKNIGNAGSGLSEFGKNLTSVGYNITALGAPFLGIAALAQNAFSQMNDATHQLDAVLKSTGGAAGVTRQQALLLASQLQDLTGITRAQIVTGEDMLLTFTNIGGTVFPRATRAVTDLSVAMKQDIKSSAIQLGKALNDPINGITALTRVGVAFTQTQKDMIKAMVEGGDVAGAQGIILSEIEKEFGGSAAAVVDPIDHLRTSLNDLAIDIGVSLQPVLKAVIPIIQDIIHSISQWITSFTDAGDNTFGIVLALGASLAIIGPILALIGTSITAIGGLFTFLAGPIGLVIAAIIALFTVFQTNFLGIRTALEPIFNWLKQTFGDVFGAIMAGVPIVDILRVILFRLLPDDVAQQIVDAITSISTFVSNLVAGIGDFITQHPDFVVALGAVAAAVLILANAGTIITGVFALFSGGVGILTGALGLLFSPITILIVALVALLAAISAGYPGGIPGALKDAANSAQQLWFIFMFYLNQAVNTVKMAFDLLKAAIEFVLSKIQEFINNVSTGANGIAGIIQLLTSGQISLGDLGNAIGNQINSVPAGNPAINSAVSNFVNQNPSVLNVNFNGTGGPTTPTQAEDSAHMLSGALQSKGLIP